MIHIVTSFDIVHKKVFDSFNELLLKINDDCLQNSIKKQFDDHFYKKSEIISSMAFENNLSKNCVKKVHNLMTKKSHENISIPEKIKSHEKYSETLFNKSIQMCDIYDYINLNIEEDEIVLLCNGNYCIGDSATWDNIKIEKKEAFCLSSIYKYVGSKQTELFKYPFPDETLVHNKDMIEEARSILYYALSHHAFMFRVPMECLLFDEFDFFNTCNVNKLMNHLLKKAGDYDIKNPHQYNSHILYDNTETNYQDTSNDNLELIKSMDINTEKYMLLFC